MAMKLIPFVIKNLLRSKTRLLATAGGCAVAAFIICFFLATGGSLNSMLARAGTSQNLIITQKDRY